MHNIRKYLNMQIIYMKLLPIIVSCYNVRKSEKILDTQFPENEQNRQKSSQQYSKLTFGLVSHS